MASMDKDLEELMSHLGEFGKYQFRQCCLHSLAALTDGVYMLSLLTVAAVPTHHCNIPNANESSVLTEGLFNFTAHSWDNSSNRLEQLPRHLGTCHYLDRENATRECDSWTYDTTYFQSSRGIEWNFVCSRRWMGAVAQSSYMFGIFAGTIILGSMADKYGRKIIFYVSAVAQLMLGVLVALVNNYYVFLVIRFLYGIFGSAYLTGFTLTMELVGPSRRTVCGMLLQLAYAAGFMLVAVWGAVLKDRMWLQIVYGLHSTILLGHWWLMDESPRWLWANGRAAEAIVIVQRGLRVNGSDIHVDAARLISRSKVQLETKEEKSHGALNLFKTPNLRKKSLIICLNWFANSIGYYGLAFNMVNLIGNPFVMLFLSGVLEIPSYTLIIFTMDRTGRRCLLSMFLMIGGLCCICAATITGATSDLAAMAMVTIVLVGKGCIICSFAVVYNYTAELFPTVMRNTALGIGSMCARFSSALTPMIFLLDSLDPRVPVALFGLIALIAGFLALYLPETMNQPMPESIEDSENFGKGDTCFTTCLGSGAKIGRSRHHDEQDTREKEELNAIQRRAHLS